MTVKWRTNVISSHANQANHWKILDQIVFVALQQQAKQDRTTKQLTTARLEADEQLIIKCHKDCVSSYTSKSHIDRILKTTRGQIEDDLHVKQIRRSSHTSTFNFKEHCLSVENLVLLMRIPNILGVGSLHLSAARPIVENNKLSNSLF